MEHSLSQRQIQILKAIIDEYIETAEAVGSESLEKKYNLGVSPATIRNEMALLTKIGYLRQPHTSSGRVPSPKAMKFYISQLMEEKSLSVTEEVKAKEQVWDVRKDLDSLLYQTTHALAQKTGTLSVGAVDKENKVWHAGYSNVFSNPEFADVMLCESLFSLMDEVGSIRELFFGREFLSPIEVLFGEEMSYKNLHPVSLIVSHFKLNGRDAVLGIIGPSRIRYPHVIPVLRYYSNLLQEISEVQ